LPFPFASSSHITSPSNSSSSFPTDELRSQTGGYHPRDEVDDYTQASDSDSDLRSPKRLRLEELTESRPAMRINQGENGVGGSTNGVFLSSNGDSQNATNGQALTNIRMQRTRRQELVRLMVQAMQDMGYWYCF
jgi:hypothetical protein